MTAQSIRKMREFSKKCNTKNLIVFAFLGIILSGCSTKKLETLKPESSNAHLMDYEIKPSFVSLPITIKIKDIENQMNTILSGLIFEDNNIEDDNIEIKVWKNSVIKLKSIGGNGIRSYVPLKIVGKYRIGTEQFGVKMYRTTDFKLSGEVVLSGKISLTNWQLKSNTELETINWDESPTISVLGKDVPITFLINTSLSLMKSKIERKIDETIEKAMDFKPHVLDALAELSKPNLINPEYSTWLRVTPIEVYASESKIEKDVLNINMGMKGTIETIVGQKPNSNFDKSKIQLKAVKEIPNQINANVIASTDYATASKMIIQNFAGQEFTSGKNKVMVKGVELWQKDQKMVVALDIEGSITGKIYLTGLPNYNHETKEIFFDNMDYVLDSKSKLLKVANWLVKGMIVKKIEANCRYSIQSNLEEINKSLSNYLNNYSPMQGVYVNGKINQLEFEKIGLTNTTILAYLSGNGTVSLKIDGLK
jgi:hypothetical protein